MNGLTALKKERIFFFGIHFQARESLRCAEGLPPLSPPRANASQFTDTKYGALHDAARLDEAILIRFPQAKRQLSSGTPCAAIGFQLVQNVHGDCMVPPPSHTVLFSLLPRNHAIHVPEQEP